MILPTAHEINALEAVILATIASKPTKQQLPVVKRIAKRLQSDGAEAIILGCTELSVIMGDQKSKNFIDPLNLAVQELIK